ncbi:hypothetical protein GCM10010095_56180 [Streptomyces anthocyanicus]|nr:hypothetical protein SLITK23_44670 [Streptomyces lividans]GGL63964.1 hypothetical protein GCM10010095_56180 [Streptomyces anthocyanicus]GHA50761.1 hypothetical protein GCM10010391_39130 [Streptomyces anthocyanicus]
MLLPIPNWLAGQREGTGSGRVACGSPGVSQLTGFNKHGKWGINPNWAPTGRGWGRLRVSGGEGWEAGKGRGRWRGSE